MRLLLTNDDGIHAPGLRALCRAFDGHHEVIVVAPERERSAVSHGITLHKPLRPVATALNGAARAWAVNGTPVDCVKLALAELVQAKPDLVISGINPGENVGINVLYSGTVAAAREAALGGVAAIAVSIQGRKATHVDQAAVFVRQLAQTVAANGLPYGTMLNVNIPDRALADMAGVRPGRQSLAPASERFEKRLDPRQRVYYWFGTDRQRFVRDSDHDGALLDAGFISITPISCDATDYRLLETLKTWQLVTSLTGRNTQHLTPDTCLLFITLEGMEGAGKTTQIDRLAALLEGRGLTCLVTREPGGTPIGQRVRQIVLDSRNDHLLPGAELLLYVADRIQHLDQVIRPALAAGRTVICDRFFDATVAYQGRARGLDLELIYRLHGVLCGGLKPDLTLLLDLPVTTGLARARRRGLDPRECRFENEALAFHQRVRQGYLDLASSEPQRFCTIDAGGDPDQVARAIATAVTGFMARRQ